MIDLTGQKFSRLTVLSEGPRKNKQRYWNCLCDCGNTKLIYQYNLTAKKSTSCGCYQKELVTTHGDYKNRIYGIWCHIKTRCDNPKNDEYHNYGGKGIRVCKAWHDYETFKKWAMSSGYKDELTIDRIDGNKNYTPDNCRWATKLTQARNRRKVHNRSSKYIGVSYRKARKYWESYIHVTSKKISLGRYPTEIEAAKARDQYIIDNNLSDFILNF